MAKCPKCGFEADTKFCPECGTQMPDQKTPEEMAKRQAELLAGVEEVFDSLAAPEGIVASTDSTKQALKLVCPKCEKQETHLLDASKSWHDLSCPECNAVFKSQYVRIRAKRSRKADSGRIFSIRVYDPGGGEHLIEFKHFIDVDVELRSGDKAVFSFLGEELKVVQNLTTNQYMVVKKPSCFVATYLYGPDSKEVHVLRHFRDTVLLPSEHLSRLVGTYYRVSPVAIEHLGGQVWFRRVASWVVRPFVRIARRWEAMQR